MDFSRAGAITFDCYGTLIDWESGLLVALRRLLGPAAAATGDEDLLSAYGALEADAERGPYRPYRDVLDAAARALGERFGVAVPPGALPDSVGQWPAFPDTPAALHALAGRFRLLIVSNVDRDLFERTRPRLGLPLEAVTAEDVRAYKPAEAHFRRALDVLNLPPQRVVHAAQSLYHDIAPARRLGIPCVWVNRRRGRRGWGATPPAHATPDLEVASLAELAALAAGA